MQSELLNIKPQNLLFVSDANQDDLLEAPLKFTLSK